MGIKHLFESAKASCLDTTVLRPSDWNANHVAGATDTGFVRAIGGTLVIEVLSASDMPGHHTSHEAGGTDIVTAAAAAHHAEHENGGADEIDVRGLSGVLADQQNVTYHDTTHENGGADEISVAGLSGVLADGQTPAAHKTSHQDGGSDEISLAGLLVTYDDMPDTSRWTDIGITVDSGSAVIGLGAKGYRPLTFAHYIRGWTFLANTISDIVMDVKWCTYNGFPGALRSIAGTEKPTLATAQINRNLALHSWTTVMAEDDILQFVVESATTITRGTVVLKVERA